jgi:hypothetical protein
MARALSAGVNDLGASRRQAVAAQLRPHLSFVRSALTIGSNEAIKNCVIEGLGG